MLFRSLWFCYSDTTEHTLSGEHALTDEGRAIIERCLLFLRCDLEFQWPASRVGLWYPILRLIGLSRIVNRRLEKETRAGDLDVWPFLKKSQYEQLAHR